MADNDNVYGGSSEATRAPIFADNTNCLESLMRRINSLQALVKSYLTWSSSPWSSAWPVGPWFYGDHFWGSAASTVTLSAEHDIDAQTFTVNASASYRPGDAPSLPYGDLHVPRGMLYDTNATPYNGTWRSTADFFNIEISQEIVFNASDYPVTGLAIASSSGHYSGDAIAFNGDYEVDGVSATFEYDYELKMYLDYKPDPVISKTFTIYLELTISNIMVTCALGGYGKMMFSSGNYDTSLHSLVSEYNNSGFTTHAGLTQTEWHAYDEDAVESLGTPDGGVSVPANLALADVFSGTGAPLSLRLLTQMRTAITAMVATGYFMHGENQYNWTASSADNLYYCAMGDRTKYGMTDGARYDWTSLSVGDECKAVYPGEILECVLLLEAAE